MNATNNEMVDDDILAQRWGLQDPHLIVDPFAHHYTKLDPFPVEKMRGNDEVEEGDIVHHYVMGLQDPCLIVHPVYPQSLWTGPIPCYKESW